MATRVDLVVWNVDRPCAAILILPGWTAVLGFTLTLWATLASGRVFDGWPSAAMSPRWVAWPVSPMQRVIPMLSPRWASCWTRAAGPGSTCGILILERVGLIVPPIVSTGWQL